MRRSVTLAVRLCSLLQIDLGVAVQRRGRSLLLSAVVTGLAAAAVLLGPTAVASAAGRTWSQASELEAPLNAEASANFELKGVACPAAGACVAVGEYGSSGLTKATVASEASGIWGTASEIEAPAPTADAELSSVACTGVGACVAVGVYEDSESRFVPILATETAGKWAKAEVIKLPLNAWSKPVGFLNSIACPASGACIAVGSYDVEGSHDTEGMILTEVGGVWGQASELTPPEHAAADPRDVLNSITCPPSGSCVAVGSYQDSTFHGQAMVVTESGGVWGTPSEVVLPERPEANPEAVLASVACSAAGTCVAVGRYDQEGKGSQAMLAHASGGAWSAAGLITPPENATSGNTGLASVACPAMGVCSAVGSYTSTNPLDPALALSGSGAEWPRGSEVLPPGNAKSGSHETTLVAVTCPEAGSCVALGTYETGTRPRQAMVAYGTGGAEGSKEEPAAGSKEKPTEGSKQPTGAKSTTSTSSSPTGKVALSATSLTVQANGQTAIKLTCTGTATCSGKLTLTVKRTTGKGKKKHTKTESIGTATFSVPADGVATIKLRLNAAGRALLKAAHGRLNATLELVKSSPSPAATEHATVHLKLKAKTKKH